MKRVIIFLPIFLVSVALAYPTEITLGFGWRISNSGLVLGENSFPLTVNRIEQYESEGELWRFSEIQHYLKDDINVFLRRFYIVLGIDFRLYERLSLGFELNVGYVNRKYRESIRHIAEVVDEHIIYDETSEIEVMPTRIIPVNFFLVPKYKFNRIRGWLSPYFGIGGGIGATVFIDGLDDSLKESDVENLREETVVYSGTFLSVVGVDIFFSKKVAVFIELKYMKPLRKGKNFREQTIIGIGFRFI